MHQRLNGHSSSPGGSGTVSGGRLTLVSGTRDPGCRLILREKRAVSTWCHTKSLKAYSFQFRLATPTCDSFAEANGGAFDSLRGELPSEVLHMCRHVGGCRWNSVKLSDNVG